MIKQFEQVNALYEEWQSLKNDSDRVKFLINNKNSFFINIDNDVVFLSFKIDDTLLLNNDLQEKIWYLEERLQCFNDSGYYLLETVFNVFGLEARSV